MATLKTIKLYNNGEFARRGYASPYFPRERAVSTNRAVIEIVNAAGKAVQAIMEQPDVMIDLPPKSLNFPVMVHNFVMRFRKMLAARQINTNQPEDRDPNNTPDPRAFKIFPARYFQVRNHWAKGWCELAFKSISAMMQHSDNEFDLVFHADFVSAASVNINLIYREMAIEWFDKGKADVEKQDFALTDADFAAYNPGKFWSLYERTDTPPPADTDLGDIDLTTISTGIWATQILLMLTPGPDDPAAAVASRDETTTSPTAESSTRAGLAVAAPVAAAPSPGV